jgi:hypothetical protein
MNLSQIEERMMHEIDRLRAFVAEVMQRAWEGYDLEGGEAEDLAKKHGLLREEPYDPDRHGESEFEIEPGDPWYQLVWK